jgi:threonyl-tRNA synthetase
MRILQLHCDNIEFTPTKKEIKSAEEIEPLTKKLEEVVVAFIAIEEGDDSNVAKKAVSEITESMKRLVVTDCFCILMHILAQNLHRQVLHFPS